ncbi:hypothetical protein ACQWF4_22260, partial [Salmonella enterica subsp. enterica serovar Infantis]
FKFVQFFFCWFAVGGIFLIFGGGWFLVLAFWGATCFCYIFFKLPFYVHYATFFVFGFFFFPCCFLGGVNYNLGALTGFFVGGLFLEILLKLPALFVLA